MAHKKYVVKSVKIKPRQVNHINFSIICFLMNMLTLPGLGSLLGGKTKAGMSQIILFFIGGLGMIYFYTLFGILALATWIWGIITGAKMIRESK